MNVAGHAGTEAEGRAFVKSFLNQCFSAHCGKSKAKSEISVTNLHHKNNKYDLENPLWNTIEVCLECHEKLDPRLRALKKNERYWFGSNAHKMRCPTCQAFAIFGNYITN